jgi:hypothetical protein
MTMTAGMPLFSRTLVVVMTKHAGKLTMQKKDLEVNLEVMRTVLVVLVMMPAGMPSLRNLWEVMLLLLLVLKMMMPAGMPKDRVEPHLVKMMMMPAGLPSLRKWIWEVMLLLLLVLKMIMTAGMPKEEWEVMRTNLVKMMMRPAGMPSLGKEREVMLLLLLVLKRIMPAGMQQEESLIVLKMIMPVGMQPEEREVEPLEAEPEAEDSGNSLAAERVDQVIFEQIRYFF